MTIRRGSAKEEKNGERERKRREVERGKGREIIRKRREGGMGGNKIRDGRRIRESKGVRFLLCMWLTQTQLPAVHVVPMTPKHRARISLEHLPIWPSKQNKTKIKRGYREEGESKSMSEKRL